MSEPPAWTRAAISVCWTVTPASPGPAGGQPPGKKGRGRAVVISEAPSVIHRPGLRPASCSKPLIRRLLSRPFPRSCRLLRLTRCGHWLSSLLRPATANLAGRRAPAEARRAAGRPGQGLLLIKGGSGRTGRLGGGSGQRGAICGLAGTFCGLRRLRTADGVCTGVAGNNSPFRSGRAVDVLEAAGEMEARSPPGTSQEPDKEDETAGTARPVVPGEPIVKPSAGRRRSLRELLLLLTVSAAEASRAVLALGPSAA